MFCPNCGRENVAGKKFCPSCGLKLQAIVEALSNEQSQRQDDDQSLEASVLLQKWWQSSLVYGLFVMLLGTSIGVLGKSILANEVIAGIGTLLALLGIGLIGFNGIARTFKRQHTSLKTKRMPPTAATVQLPPAVEPGSITEQTTRNLDLKLARAEKRTPSQELFQP